MNQNYLVLDIPWLSLPEEVRQRVMDRFKAITGHFSNDPLDGIDVRAALCDLGKSRLIELFKGNVKAAIRYAVRHASDSAAYGTDPAEWRAAQARSKELSHRLANDPVFMVKGILLHQLAVQEMARRN